MYSPFGKLPKYESFGKDMSEHVVFENLPDYTGTWDKMTGLISRIRWVLGSVAQPNSALIQLRSYGNTLKMDDKMLRQKLEPTKKGVATTFFNSSDAPDTDF